MARKTVRMGDFSKGITPSLSDKKTQGWKQMTNVNQAEELGSIETRYGTVPSEIYFGGAYGGSESETKVQVPGTEAPYTIFYNHGNLSYYGNWVTNPNLEVYFCVSPSKTIYIDEVTFKMYGIGTWSTDNPGVSMQLDLMQYTITPHFLPNTAPPLPDGTRHNFDTYNFNVDNFGVTVPTIGSSVRSLSDVASIPWTGVNPTGVGTDVNFVFNGAPGGTAMLVPGNNYAFKITLTGITTKLVNSVCDLCFVSQSATNSAEKLVFVRLNGGREINLSVQRNNLKLTAFPKWTSKGQVMQGAQIPDPVAVKQTQDGIFVVNTTSGGAVDLAVSADRISTHTIRPVENDPANVGYLMPNYEMGTERYGVSIITDGERYYSALLSSLLQPEWNDGEILQYKFPDPLANRVNFPTLTATVFGYSNSFTTFTQGAWSVYPPQPASTIVYGVQYIYEGGGASEIAYSNLQNTGTVRPAGTTTNYDNGKTIGFKIPSQPNININKAIGINIFRKSVVYAFGVNDRVYGKEWQCVGHFENPDLVDYRFQDNQISATWNKAAGLITIDDKSPYIRSDDSVLLYNGNTEAVYIPGAVSHTNYGAIQKYYISPGVPVFPTPGFLFVYNGRTFALGDKDNRTTVFFSKDSLIDFYADNTFTLDLPIEDFCLTAGFTLGESAYVCSNHKVFRVTEVSDALPYYKVEPVAGCDGIGCISPKSIVTVGGLVYFLSSEGYVVFNGSGYVNISNEIVSIFRNIDQNFTDSAGGTANPMIDNVYYAPYLVTAVYNEQDRCIYLAIPDNSTTRNNTLLKYSTIMKNWTTVAVNKLVGLVEGTRNGIDLFTSDDIFASMRIGDKTDTMLGTLAPVPAILETYDIVIPNQSMVNLITLYGTGTVNVYIYLNRSLTPAISKMGVTLKMDGTDIPINRQGFEVRYRIESVTSEDFKLTAEPEVTVTGSGQRLRGDIE